jgi:energy-converting hydrogenase Eha subunit B
MKRKQDLPSDFDYKFAELTIDAYIAIYEQTGKFMPETQLKRIAREIRKMGKEITTGAGMGLIVCACLYAPIIMKG